MTSRIQHIVKRDARDQLEQITAGVGDLDKRIRELVRQRPLGTLLAAAFVGHVIGRLVARR